MLDNMDIIESYIDKSCKRLKDEALSNISQGMNSKVVLDTLVEHTVRDFTPESKSILNSVYNTMSKQTLSEDFFKGSFAASEFYKRDLLTEISRQFSFDVPTDISYSSASNQMNQLIAAGAVIAVGGVFSICIQNVVPVAIAAVLVGIMAYIKVNRKTANNTVEKNIDLYLDTVKKSLLLWVNNIAQYYDEQVSKLNEQIGR